MTITWNSGSGREGGGAKGEGFSIVMEAIRGRERVGLTEEGGGGGWVFVMTAQRG